MCADRLQRISLMPAHLKTYCDHGASGVSVLTAEVRKPLVADDWVQRMIDSPGRSNRLKDGDRHIHYLEWGKTTNPRVLLLLHGFMGHAHWWDFVAPWFAQDYRVIAMDLAGMGDSSPRDQYSTASFLGEVGAMLAFIDSPSTTLVGHSMGGRVSVFAAHRHPQYLKHVIIVDSKLGFNDVPRYPRMPPRGVKIYPDLETVISRFHFLPDEPPLNPIIMQHLISHSIRREGTGYTWKFDPTLTHRDGPEQEMEGELLPQIELPLDYLYGELSAVVDRSYANRIGNTLRNGRGPIEIPAAYHHVPLDQPLALVAALRSLLL